MKFLLVILCFACLAFDFAPQTAFAQVSAQNKARLIDKKNEMAKNLDLGRLRLRALEGDRLARLEELEQLYAAQRVVKSNFASDIANEIYARAKQLKELEAQKADLLEQMESFQFALDQINNEIAVLDKEMK